MTTHLTEAVNDERPWADSSSGSVLGSDVLPRTEAVSVALPLPADASDSLVALAAFDEYIQRLRAGERLDPEAYVGRFPRVRSVLGNLIRGHHDARQFIEEHAHLLAEPPPAAWPNVGSRFLGYVLQEPLGRGAFARVFRASDPARGDVTVVVKVAYQGGTEGKILGPLKHPNIVPVVAAREEEATGLTAVCMPYCGRATLHNLLDRAFADNQTPRRAAVILETAHDESLPPPGQPSEPLRHSYIEGVRHLGAQIADALAYVHGRDICHRDLKPSNVLLAPDGTPLLLDFNLSTDPRQAEVRLGGTLVYMAPEQLRATNLLEKGSGLVFRPTAPTLNSPELGEKPILTPFPTEAPRDRRSDLYSLGVILYELLSGEHPFAPVPYRAPAPELCQYLLGRQQQGFRPLREVSPGVDRRLGRLVERCLASDPDDRPQSAAEVARELRRYPLHQRARQWSGRHPWLAALLLVCALGLGLYGGLAGASALLPGPSQYERGIQAYRGGKYQKAVDHFSQSLATEADKVETWFALGRAHEQLALMARKEDRQKYLNKAQMDFDKVEQHNPNGRMLAYIGYFVQRNFRHDPTTYYARAVVAGFQSAEVYNNWGAALLENQDGKALEKLNQALQLNPELQTAFYHRAHFWLNEYEKVRPMLTGKELDAYLNKARADISQAVQSGPGSGELYLLAARIYSVSLRYEGTGKAQALMYLEKAIQYGFDLREMGNERDFGPLQKDEQFQRLLRLPPGQVGPREMARVLDPLQGEQN